MILSYNHDSVIRESIENNKIMYQRELIWSPGKEEPLCATDVKAC